MGKSQVEGEKEEIIQYRQHNQRYWKTGVRNKSKVRLIATYSTISTASAVTFSSRYIVCHRRLQKEEPDLKILDDKFWEFCYKI